MMQQSPVQLSRGHYPGPRTWPSSSTVHHRKQTGNNKGRVTLGQWKATGGLPKSSPENPEEETTR